MSKKAETSKMIMVIVGLIVAVIVILVIFGIWRKLACIFLPELC